MPANSGKPSLKLLTARTLKWNAVDRLSSQVIYAAVGVVLANVLSKEDFGLVGVLLMFQAFATIFVDSGFGAALLQKREPTQRDYSTVLWFNIGVSLSVYIALWIAAPLIADIFHDDRLRAMSKVMFLSFVVNALGIVQTNRLMKRMEVRAIALSNLVAMLLSGGLGIWMAMHGYGAWAMIWQTLSMAAAKTLLLWATGGWLPSAVFSMRSLREIRRVGTSVFTSALLNTASLQLYNFVVGAFYNLRLLGLYTQADKWSKMASASLSQILTSSFVPLLARVQDDEETFRRYAVRALRFTAFLAIPCMLGLAVTGRALFHFLFSTKWDEAIPLFQILALRGILVVHFSLYSNFLLAKGKARGLFAAELAKDLLTVGAILCTVWSGNLTILVWGQFVASLATLAVTAAICRRSLGAGLLRLTLPTLPFAAAGVLMALVCMALTALTLPAGLMLLLQAGAGAAVYLLILLAARVPELPEALSYLRRRIA